MMAPRTHRIRHRAPATAPAVAALAALLLSGCQSAAPAPTTATPTPAGPPVYLARTTQDTGNQADAAFAGTLGLTTEGCFGLTAEGWPTALGVFPLGTTILPAGDGIDVPDYGRIRLGDAFTAGGGSGSTSGAEGIEVPTQCTDAQADFLHPVR